MNNMNNMNAFDLTVRALRDKGLDSDKILVELSILFRKLNGIGVPAFGDKFPERDIPKFVSDCDKEKLVKDFLFKMGFQSRNKGFDFATRAILRYAKNPKQKLTSELYPAVAEDFHTTDKAVERGIRYSCEAAWALCPRDLREKVFGNTIFPKKDKPTNGQFVAAVVHYLNL